jgi:hypothetical protein
MTDIKEIKINVPIPVSKTRKGKRVPKVEKPVIEKPLLEKPVSAKKLVGGEPLPVLSTIRVGGSKKPVVKVQLPYSNSPHTPSPPIKPVPAPIKVVQKTVIRKTPPAIKVLVQPTKRKNFTMKRKFTEKKITIQVENSNKIKKNRESIEKKVKNMPLSEITEKLRARGLVRAMSNPPEAMQRTMMTDILMFPTPL